MKRGLNALGKTYVKSKAACDNAKQKQDADRENECDSKKYKSSDTKSLDRNYSSFLQYGGYQVGKRTNYLRLENSSREISLGAVVTHYGFPRHGVTERNASDRWWSCGGAAAAEAALARRSN